MLAGGVLSPMLEVEVRVTKIDATLLGTPIEFRDQSLYYRSKTVFEVFETLIHMGRPEMTVVGVLVILFSVVFPTLKMLALGRVCSGRRCYAPTVSSRCWPSSCRSGRWPT